MSHTVKDKQKLLSRARKIRGQVEALERALETEKGCNDILQLITSARGAMNSLLAVVLEEHIRTHLVDTDHPHSGEPGEAQQQLIDIVHSYFK